MQTDHEKLTVSVTSTLANVKDKFEMILCESGPACAWKAKKNISKKVFVRAKHEEKSQVDSKVST